MSVGIVQSFRRAQQEPKDLFGARETFAINYDCNTVVALKTPSLGTECDNKALFPVSRPINLSLGSVDPPLSPRKGR